MLSTLTVVNTDDSGPGSLHRRWTRRIRTAGATRSSSPPVRHAADDHPHRWPARADRHGRHHHDPGPGPSLLAISGDEASRVFQVDTGVTAVIEDLEITGGQRRRTPRGMPRAAGSIPAATSSWTTSSSITRRHRWGRPCRRRRRRRPRRRHLHRRWGRHAEQLHLSNDTAKGGDAAPAREHHRLTGGTGGAGQGGGLFNDGTATLTDCTLTGDSATGGSGGNADLYGGGGGAGQGGGLFNGETATLTGCTFTGDSTMGGSGGDAYHIQRRRR